MTSPLKQFDIIPLHETPLMIAGYPIYFTNSTLYMMGTIIILGALFLLFIKKGTILPGRGQIMCEMIVDLVANMLKSTAGNQAMRYFPFIFSLFIFILLGNLLGMLPMIGFTFTSHIIITFSLAFFLFCVITLIAIMKHGFKFLSFFVPDGAPFILLPLIIPIEIVSYLSRPISLSVRLFANMMAGHIMMKVFAGFAVTMGVFSFIPVLVNIGLIGFEICIAGLQAYVFTLLTCIYLNDALHLHA